MKKMRGVRGRGRAMVTRKDTKPPFYLFSASAKLLIFLTIFVLLTASVFAYHVPFKPTKPKIATYRHYTAVREPRNVTIIPFVSVQYELGISNSSEQRFTRRHNLFRNVSTNYRSNVQVENPPTIVSSWINLSTGITRQTPSQESYGIKYSHNYRPNAYRERQQESLQTWQASLNMIKRKQERYDVEKKQQAIESVNSRDQCGYCSYDVRWDVNGSIINQ